MELKDYQARALDSFGRWIEALEEARLRSLKGMNALEEVGIEPSEELRDYPKAAWRTMAKAGAIPSGGANYASRSDETGRPVPHVCIKVPTGGGKTLLAAAALERLGRQTGLTLWIVPTRAIYEQTWRALGNREHPYRRILERASGGRFKLLQKEDRFTASDTAHYMCLMLLMLPATNRQKGKEFLRMFRDSGRYPSFFPDGDDLLGDERLLNAHPDLERNEPDGPVKRSLYNLMKMLRPVVVLDEAHKAYGRKRAAGEEFARSVSRLGPRMVIELSATPHPGISNLLVDVGGLELKAEEMVKLPIGVTSFTNVAWSDTLMAAHEELGRLTAEAECLEIEEGRYIRPIAVVRVERTGKEQRDGQRVHAEDVRECLVQKLGVHPDAVAVKSAERDELAGANLLSKLCPVRWIITKAALMEGWDCSFAYVLTMLDNTRAVRAVTQLVGRILRQPHALRTGRESLDRCYVYCWNTDVGLAVENVRAGLEAEGLASLASDVVSASDGRTPGANQVEVLRRRRFRGQRIFLPLVLHREGGGWRELDFMEDILPKVDWDAIGAPGATESLAEVPMRELAIVDVESDAGLSRAKREISVDKTPMLSWFARRLSDIVPNSWQAARIVRELTERLQAEGATEDAIHDRRSWLVHETRRHVTAALDAEAERVFHGKLGEGEIRFDLNPGRPSYKLVERYELAVPDDSRQMLRRDRSSLQLSLFEPVYTHQFDSVLERNFASYLDERAALQWWHRVAARQGGDYYLRGWKRHRIWPDFIAMGGFERGRQQLMVFETKGPHLDGSDTRYKERVFRTLEGAFDCGSMTVREGPAKGVFRLVFSEAEFPHALASLGEAGGGRPPSRRAAP